VALIAFYILVLWMRRERAGFVSGAAWRSILFDFNLIIAPRVQLKQHCRRSG